MTLRSSYGISLDDYDKMYSEQEGKCRLCGETYPNRGKDRLVVDHCHNTGQVRKLLCNACNSILGFSKERIFVLNAAIMYLMHYGKTE